ncbi:MAG: hypothetical protein D6698_16065, partial [Gammaproteobacteria bacterium]
RKPLGSQLPERHPLAKGVFQLAGQVVEVGCEGLIPNPEILRDREVERGFEGFRGVCHKRPARSRFQVATISCLLKLQPVKYACEALTFSQLLNYTPLLLKPCN